MAFPPQPSNQKWRNCLAKTPMDHAKISTASILDLVALIGTM
jgi:hypothetical protein